MVFLQSLTRTDLEALLLPLALRGRDAQKAEKRARYQARQIFHWAYQRMVLDWDLMTDLSKDLRAWLKENIEIYRLKERHTQHAEDGTRKFLWDLVDHKTVESVVIPVMGTDEESGEEEISRLTACISSQVGCAMGCKFCLTGVQGLDRHLQVHEIVTQVHELRVLAPITNIVFMGMGEPLHNVENVIKACEILLDGDGLKFSKRKVTVSTSGLVPAIAELGARTEVMLAVSLNASTDEQRSEIMPVNHRWDIDELLTACRNFPVSAHRRVTFEYVLLKDFNDSLEDAARLVRLTKGMLCKFNLIPFNEHPASTYKRPSDETVEKFQRYLMDRDVTALVRTSRGRDILAACGQLRSIFGTARGTEKHKDWKPSVKQVVQPQL